MLVNWVFNLHGYNNIPKCRESDPNDPSATMNQNQSPPEPTTHDPPTPTADIQKSSTHALPSNATPGLSTSPFAK